MILAVKILVAGSGSSHPRPAAIPSGLPSLFGASIYSFMCHHSLPALVTPISNKSRLFHLFALDYFLIASFYLLLALTGVFAFDNIFDLYTLNFQPNRCDSSAAPTQIEFLQYFLALFPVFTLSTSFPIIAITLRNNLKSLFLKEGRRYGIFLERLLFPVLAILPPSLVGLATHDVELLVGITGSYAGSGIQYIIPATLVYYARKEAGNVIGTGVKNQHASPFRGTAWVVLVVLWAIACIVLVTVNHILALTYQGNK